MIRTIFAIACLGLASACASSLPTQNHTDAPAETFDLIAEAKDGIQIYGTASFSDLPTSSPLIVLFHQGGSNVRGEYQSIIPWLNENGYRVAAWDLRAGGDTYGSSNRTADAMLPEKAGSYCDAYPDMEAALEASANYVPAQRMIVWGSSYSAALVFHLVADHPEQISHILAFSPASGGPMIDCRARDRLSELTSPAFVLKPASEMERETSQEQRSIFETAGVDFLVVSQGVHGSSLLVDERTGADMSEARSAVLEWLARNE